MAESWGTAPTFCYILLHILLKLTREYSCLSLRTLNLGLTEIVSWVIGDSFLGKRIRNVLHRPILWLLKISKRAVQTNLKSTEARQKENFSFKFLGFILLFQELSLPLQLESNHTIVRTSIFLMVKLAFAIRSCKLERRKFQKEH